MKGAQNGHSMTIEQFYKGKNVFLTGGTGFLGKVLIDKLLRSCPDIGNIYFLARPKKGMDIQRRLDKLLADQLFNTLKQNHPSQLKKIIPLSGDCSELLLGLSPTDYNLLTSSVNVIFHVAASVRFDDSLRAAILLNTRGTREVCNLALQTNDLAVFVHISTTYSNCSAGKNIEEELYPAPGDWRKAIKIAEELDKDLLPCFSDKYLEPYPNTYTFTKALGEHVVNDLCKGVIPTIICRPSIVISSLNDPIGGWNDNFNGPVGLLVACGKGLLRVSYQDKNVFPDYIPVDSLIKSLIIASWHTALKKDLSTVEVINHCAGKGWLSIDKLSILCKKLSEEVPFNDIIWIPKGGPTACKYYNYFCLVIFHLIPALIFDLALKLSGRKPMLMKLHAKVFGATIQLRYFTLQEWNFKNEKFRDLEKKLLDEDEKIWRFDFDGIDVPDYIKKSMIGARLYLLKEADETFPQAKRHYRRMYWVDRFAMTLLYGSLIWMFYRFNTLEILSNYISNTFYYYIDGSQV